jgi:hypothetical protein
VTEIETEVDAETEIDAETELRVKGLEARDSSR